MNLEKVFNLIKEKRGYNVPVRYKLLNGMELTKEDLNVKGNLNLNNTKITSLPDNLHVGGYLDLQGLEIVELPDNLHVGGFLILNNTKITSLPDNLYVKRGIYLSNTPIAEKYSKEEVEKMIEAKGGSVGYVTVFTPLL
jgi:hypothetical protein